MKILIADDDKLIRYYMKSLISEVMMDTYEIIEASNGKSLIELCCKHSPQIAFVDIKMPYLDGISAIEKSRISCPHTKFVVLTAYADFSYAKRCIALGVDDYLLKPVESETLEKLLNDLTTKIKTESSFDSIKFQHKVISLFNSPINNKNSRESNLKNDNTQFLYFEFFIICKNYDEIYNNMYSTLSNDLVEFTDDIVKFGSTSVIFNSKLGNLLLVIQATKERSGYIVNSLNLILQKHNKYENLNISCLSTSSITLYDLLDNAIQINQKSSCIYACSSGQVQKIEDIVSKLYKEDFAFLDLFSKVISAYIDSNEPEYSINIKSLIKNTHFESLNIDFKTLISYTDKITGHTFKEIKPMPFLKELLRLNDSLKINISQSSLDKINLIREYIDKNYMNDISISTISEIYNLTPNYVSKLFHDKFEVKFSDYLTQVRIYNAKLLLASSKEVSIKTVSSLVGYNSPRHFTNIFYKTTNVYPSDYKKGTINDNV
ncbi:response regulator [Paenibacillus sp.]|uniref:response regulator transcription factor n=1 Tax=Paenibacillus sp. TaxID=58172 RepID=UPI0028B0897E|nr:response regulator [Paenibacillus sp.]